MKILFQVYYVHNINSGRKNSVDESSDKVSLKVAVQMEKIAHVTI